ncbi:hypothetical protein O0L34_g14556 [Tuta absoluta]|nr:hypothetical protein O0L34_g19016 [Tuta absoluta]KAJ2939236.1 hypothetical protein O0L34_g8548 [Tuta absoluta]KAJ2941510.1 hypothetical protein O0L34_g14556 [Tuta absoluta]
MVNKICVACQAKVTKRSGRVCDVATCRRSYHFKCMDMTDLEIEALKKSTIAWTCPSCVLQDSLNSSTSSADSTRTVKVIPRCPSKVKVPPPPPPVVEIPNVISLHATVQALLSSNKKILDRLIQIEQQITELRINNERLTELEKRRDEDKRRIAELEARVERAEAQGQDCSVEIRGVPAVDGEDLYQHVEKLSHEVGAPVTRHDLSLCTRTRVINVANAGKPRQHQPIVVRFVHKYKRDMFLKKCREKRDTPLTTVALQVSGTPSRIYVNEHLTSAQKTLLFKAKEHFKQNLSYLYVWVQDGKILIRKDMNAPIQAIKNKQDFLNLTKINLE